MWEYVWEYVCGWVGGWVYRKRRSLSHVVDCGVSLQTSQQSAQTSRGPRVPGTSHDVGDGLDPIPGGYVHVGRGGYAWV